MTAFKAEFVEFQQVKTRSVYKIVLEIPAEQADEALAVLGGVPKPNAQVWVAVARLGNGVGGGDGEPQRTVNPRPSGSVGSSPTPPTTLLKDMGKSLVQRAGMLCRDEKFQDWCREKYIQAPVDWEDIPDPEAWTAAYLCMCCGIQSRSELATNHEAQRKFLELEQQYMTEHPTGPAPEETRAVWTRAPKFWEDRLEEAWAEGFAESTRLAQAPEKEGEQ